MFNHSKIYVAGHTGLLGSSLVRRLKAEGFSNVLTKSHEELDLTRQQSVHAFFEEQQPEYVFLCAGLTGGILANKTYPAEFLHTNLAIQDNLFQAAQEYSVKHLVFYGSSCAYPKHCPQPIKEEYLLTGKIEETSEAYASAKIAGIMACKAYNSQFKKNRFIALIPNSMYGPGDSFELEHSHVLSALLRKIDDAKFQNRDHVVLWGSGAPRREFVFSEDAADASIFAVKNAERLQNVHYNLGTGSDCTIKELAEQVARIVGFDGEVVWDRTRPEGTPRKLLDSTKFCGLGWRPSTTLERGLKITYDWYVNHIKNH